MKKLLLILLCLPMIGFGQTITAEMHTTIFSSEEKEIITIDITNDINVEFISLRKEVYGLVFSPKVRWMLDFGRKKKNGKPHYLKIKPSSKVVDGNAEIKLISNNDVINFMSKYGYSYEGTTSQSYTSGGGSRTNRKGETVVSPTRTKTVSTLTFRNDNN